MPDSQNSENSGIVTTLLTNEDGDLVLPFPFEIFDILDWREGDTLNIQTFAGRIVFSKVSD